MKYVLPLALISTYAVVSCLGLYMIKAAEVWNSIPFFFGVALYGFGAVLWLVILRNFPLSFAFPVAAGGLIVFTMLTGRLFLNESLSGAQLFGAVLIIFGILFTATRK